MNPTVIRPVRRRPSLRLNKPADATRVMNPTPINATAATQPSTTKLVVTYDQVVRLCGVPKYSAGAQVPASAREASPTQIELTYAAPINGNLVIPFGDGGVSNASGGRVNPREFGLALQSAAAEPMPALKAA